MDRTILAAPQKLAMRQTHRCPKCNHNRILHLTQVADLVGGYGAEIQAEPKPGPERAGSQVWRLARTKVPPEQTSIFWGNEQVAGIVEAYCCRGCGFVEFHVRDPESIAVDGEIVRELVAPETDPYR